MSPMLRGAFSGPNEELSGSGKRPVVFDILGPDYKTSMLKNYKMVLHVNPSSMSISYSKVIDRQQTIGGFVEAHFGDGAQTISFDMATGGFVRVYTGVTGTSGRGASTGYRRQTLAYDSYLNILKLYQNNGAIVDTKGNIVYHGICQIYFDGFYYLGTFNSFSVTDAAEQPYQFQLNAEFTVHQEKMGLRSVSLASSNIGGNANENYTPANTSLPDDSKSTLNRTPQILSTQVPTQDGASTETPAKTGGFRDLVNLANSFTTTNKFTGEVKDKDIK